MLFLQSLSLMDREHESESSFRCILLFAASFTSLDDFTSNIGSENPSHQTISLKGKSQLQGRLKDKIDPNIVQ